MLFKPVAGLPSMPKLFIYKSENTAEQSVEDIKELFTRYDILTNPDITFSTFDENFSGLNAKDNPTLIIPGGRSINIGMQLVKERKLPTIKKLVDTGFNYLGICAGAYLAPYKSDIFKADYKLGFYGDFEDMPHMTSTTSFGCNLDLVREYSGWGPFYPNDTYVDYESSEPWRDTNFSKPYCTQLTFDGNTQIPQLYLDGCGFTANAEKSNNNVESLARYADRKAYTFFNSASYTTTDNLSAIIRRKRDTQKGGIFLSGTHIESCVPDSKMLVFFNSPENNKKAALLSETNYKTLLDSQPLARDKLIPLIKETFSTTI